MNFTNIEEFYPTPDTLLEKITDGMDFRKVETVLEPSAGKGNIVDFLVGEQKKYDSWYDHINNRRWKPIADIDCIEQSEELRCVLKGKKYRVVGDDFLTFRTYKHYDLIFMNPPFSEGTKHLMKAISMQEEHGGAIICIVNAETIRNPYSNERKVLVEKLKDLQANIEYLENEFVSAERPTGVEIAVVKIVIEKEPKSRFFEEARDRLKKRSYAQAVEADPSDLVEVDYIRAAISHYEAEVEAGINLIREYKAMKPYIQNSLKDNGYSSPCIQLKIGGDDTTDINKYVQMVRAKYWEALFADRRFTGKMTNDQRNSYMEKVRELKNYDFSYYNIKEIQIEMSRNLVQGIEDCIMKLFDELSCTYSWEPGSADNIHYYNGWRTNKSWIINKKVIFPVYDVWNKIFKRFEYRYSILSKLSDIEKALNYLDGGLTDSLSLSDTLVRAEKEQQTKKIECKYFFVTFFKKGTCHLEFKDEELLKKLNIFGSQQKKWLPPSYGKKAYDQMEVEEKAIVDEFDDGKDTYSQVLAKSDYYIYNPATSIPRLEDAS